MLRNPALTPDIPFGIGAFRERRLRGVMMCVPSRFCDSSVTRTCVLSVLFYVDGDSRGAGLPLFLKFRAMAGRYPLYVATANAVVGQLWARLGGIPIAGSDCEYIRVCRFLPIGQEMLARAIRRPSSSGRAEIGVHRAQYSRHELLLPLATPDEAAEAECGQKAEQYEIVRDAEFFRWKVYDTGERVYAYRSSDSRCLCVFQHSRRGYRQQIACTEIVDLSGDLAARDVSDFLSTVKQAFSPDMIMFRGCSRLAGIEALAGKFKKRQFASPSAWIMDPNRLLEGRFGYSPLAGE
jgi:hypothetical protein